jgi:hypothetical protein
MAALRDASWLDHPETSSPKRYHICREDSPALAVCGTFGMLQDGRPAYEVPESLRCRKRGCRELWPQETKET